jgi:hypothetical protein
VQDKEAKTAWQELTLANCKADKRCAAKEEWAQLCNNPDIEFQGKLNSSEHSKVVLQTICSLLDLSTDTALRRANYIASIKTKISGSTKLQEDPHFKDLDWDNTGCGWHWKRCKTSKNTEVAQEEDGNGNDGNNEGVLHCLQAWHPCSRLTCNAAPPANPAPSASTPASTPACTPSSTPPPVSPCPQPRLRPACCVAYAPVPAGIADSSPVASASAPVPTCTHSPTPPPAPPLPPPCLRPVCCAACVFAPAGIKDPSLS